MTHAVEGQEPAPAGDGVFEKVDLPSGAWVSFRDPEQMTEKQRRPIKRWQTRISMDKMLQDAFRPKDGAAPVDSSQLSDGQLDLLSNWEDTVAVCLLTEWSFELPISIEGLQSVPGAKDYQAIKDAAMKHEKALLPDFEPTPDPESPTGPSVDSEAF